jgi:hypothetical protein
MNFWEKITKIDRRYIFIVVAIGVLLPYLFPMNLPVDVTRKVEAIYDYIEALPEHAKPVLVSMDFDPSTAPELAPMSTAFIQHCFRRNIPVVAMTLHPQGPGLVQGILAGIAGQMGKVYGEDWVFLGYKAGGSIVIRTIGEDIRQAFPQDYYNNPLDSNPLMMNVTNYKDFSLVISFSGSQVPMSWIAFAHEQYGANVAAGLTAVMAADFYPYLQTGQLVGLIAGLRGAAEYETLVDTKLGHKKEVLKLAKEGDATAQKEAELLLSTRSTSATKGMDAQSIIHMLVVFFIIIANISYFFSRRLQKQEGRK